MAFATGMKWRVRQGGNAANGGGFDPTVGVPGTDRSRQDAAQTSYTDIVIGSAGNEATGTSAANPFTSADVGNVINITAGTGFTVQRVVILSQAAGVATFDKVLGTADSTGGTGVLGGAFALPEEADVLMVGGNITYIESNASYSSATTHTLGADGSNLGYMKFIGCAAGAAGADADIAEASQPVFTSATNSISIFTLNGMNRAYFRNIKVTHTALTRGTGWANVTSASNEIVWVNCVADGCLIGWHLGTTAGTSILLSRWQGCVVRNCTGTGATAGGWYGGAFTTGSSFFWDYCVAEDNASSGWALGTTTTNTFMFFKCCIADTNAGDGIVIGATTAGGCYLFVENCAFYNNGLSAIHSKITSGRMLMQLKDNIFVVGASPARYAVECDTALVNEYAIQRNNAFFINAGSFGSGVPRVFLSAGEGDVTLTGDPFTNASGGDFSLNSTSGAGAACRGTGHPAKVGLSDDATATSVDIGPSWPPIGGSSGGMLVHPGMAGGVRG